MKQRFRLYRRSSTRRFYIQDSVTGKQETLGTADRVEALRLLHSKNEADRQPAINLQIARAYLAAGDPDIMTRTWQVVMDELIKTKQGSTRSIRFGPCRSCRHGPNITCTRWRRAPFRPMTSFADSTTSPFP